MKKAICLVLLAAVSAAPAVMAQQIEPVWEYLISGDSSPLPILKKNEPTSGETWDGTDLYDSYGGFERYDDSRLLLGVRENGINESDADHDAALAAEYPDRSLIWISPVDGSPMGVALEVGFSPVDLDQEFLDEGGSTSDYYMNFGVAEDGIVYVGYKNKIIKYEPDGDYTFGDPIVVYTQPYDDSGYWQAWRWETFKVSGSGADTVIFAGGKTWRTNQKYYYLTTDDGNTFEPTTEQVDFRGGGSSPYVSPAGDELWIIGGNFPGGASGFGVDIRRVFSDLDASESFLTDELFTFTAPEIDVEAQNYLDTYIGWFFSGFDAKTGLSYFAVYSTPSWDTKDSGTAGTLGFADAAADTPYLPGWLALHDAETGEYIEDSAHMLAVYEGDEIDGDTVGDQPMSRWHGALGDIQLNVLSTAEEGAAELLWYSGIYGYGRYKIGDIGETSVPEWSIY